MLETPGMEPLTMLQTPGAEPLGMLEMQGLEAMGMLETLGVEPTTNQQWELAADVVWAPGVAAAVQPGQGLETATRERVERADLRRPAGPGER